MIKAINNVKNSKSGSAQTIPAGLPELPLIQQVAMHLGYIAVVYIAVVIPCSSTDNIMLCNTELIRFRIYWLQIVLVKSPVDMYAGCERVSLV